jgi:hypothetical protein
MVATKARATRATRSNKTLPTDPASQLPGKKKAKGSEKTRKGAGAAKGKGKGKGAAKTELDDDEAASDLKARLKMMRTIFASLERSMSGLKDNGTAVDIMREFLDAIQVTLKGTGKDLSLSELATAGEQAVEKSWTDTVKVHGDISQALMALNVAFAQTQLMVVEAAKMEEEAANDEDKDNNDDGGRRDPKKKTTTQAAAAKAAEAAAKETTDAAEEARKAKELADKRKATEASKKRAAMGAMTEHAEPEKMSAFLKSKGVATIQKKLLRKGGTIMEIMDACNFEQQKELLALAASFDFGHAIGRTERSEPEGSESEGSESEDEMDTAVADKRGPAGARGEDVSFIPTFSIAQIEARRPKVTELMLTKSRDLKQVMEAASKSAARGDNARKQWTSRLKEIQGEDFLSFESYSNAALMIVRNEPEMQVARALKSAQRDAFAATAMLIQSEGFSVVDMLRSDAPSACAANTLACEPIRYGGVAAWLDRDFTTGEWKDKADYILGMRGNPLLLECAHMLELVALAFGQVISASKAVMPDTSEAGLVEHLTSPTNPNSALCRAQDKMQRLAQAEGEHASHEQLAELSVMKRAVAVIMALLKVVYKSFPSSKRAAMAAAFGLCIATGLLPVSARSIKHAMAFMADMRGASASSYAFVATDPLEESMLQRLEITFTSFLGRRAGGARLLEVAKPSTARKSGAGEGKVTKGTAAATRRIEADIDESDDEKGGAYGGRGPGGAAGGGDEEREILKKELLQQKGAALYADVIEKGSGSLVVLLKSISATTKFLNLQLRTKFEADSSVPLGDKACPSCLKQHLVAAPCLLAQARAVVINVSEQIKPGGFQQAKVMLAKPPQKGETFEVYAKRVNLQVSKKGVSSSDGRNFSGAKRKRETE